MPNKYLNLAGTDKIKDTYDDINAAFASVEADFVTLETKVDDDNLVQDERMDEHVAGTAERHSSDDIDNDSDVVSGDTITDAIDAVKNQLDAAVLAASNANIGVFSMNGTGVDTITATYATLTYFTGLKVRLTTAGTNTTAVTLNINSSVAKSIKVKDRSGTKSSLLGGEMPAIADLEYDGTDFILLNGQIASYTTSATSTAQIIPLSSTALKNRLDVMLSGNTVTNILPDDVAGCEATAPFGAGSCTIATDSSNEIEGTNCIKATLTATTEAFVRYSMLSLLDSSKYYLITAHVKNGNLSGSGIRLQFNSDDTDVTGSYVTSTGYSRLGVVIQPSNFNTATFAYLKLLFNGSDTQYAYIDGLMLQEITSAEYALGASALLTKYAYHRGTKSTDKIRVLSEGKNLFDKSKVEYNKYIDSNGVLQTSAAGYCASQYIQVSPSTSYRVSGLTQVAGLSHYFCYYDKNKTFISGVQVSPTAETIPNGTYTTPSNAKYMRFSVYSVDLNVAQIELGLTATTKVDYTETSAIIPTDLKKISATIADTYDGNTGIKTKNVEVDLDVSGTQYDSLSTALTNVDVVITTAFALSKFGGTGVDGTTLVLDKNGKKLEEVADASVDNVSSIGKYNWTSSGKVWFIVAKGAYVDIAAARTGLGTSQVYYQLATPVPTNYLPSVINAEPSGRIVVEPFVEDVGLYGSNITIENSSYPINSLESVYKINAVDGSMIPVSLSSVTVAAGGLSFTISGAVAGEYYLYGYTHKDMSTVSDVTYSYSNNLKAAVDGNMKTISEIDNKIETLKNVEKSRVLSAPITVGTVSATTTMISFISPKACDIVGFSLASTTGVSTSDTNYWTVELIDNGSDGSATNVIATKNTKVTGGSAIVAKDAWEFSSLDMTHRRLAAGDVVTLVLTKTGSASDITNARAALQYTEL